MPMKFPYGIADFCKMRLESYFYCDRTDKIPLLETVSSQIFIRPQRFGKSLLLSMLDNYSLSALKQFQLAELSEAAAASGVASGEISGTVCR